MKKIFAEVSGSVWDVPISVGQAVVEGEVLVVVESMKMEIPVEAPSAGTVREVLVSKGETVTDGQWIVTLD